MNSLSMNPGRMRLLAYQSLEAPGVSEFSFDIDPAIDYVAFWQIDFSAVGGVRIYFKASGGVNSTYRTSKQYTYLATSNDTILEVNQSSGNTIECHVNGGCYQSKGHLFVSRWETDLKKMYEGQCMCHRGNGANNQILNMSIAGNAYHAADDLNVFRVDLIQNPQHGFIKIYQMT